MMAHYVRAAAELRVGRIISVTDNISPSLRSRVMSRVRGKDTAPEILVRRLVHRMGFRYRLHRRDLPGTPDLVFPGRKKIIFVHGCFWHQHDCARGTRPASNADYWNAKLDRNIRRDEMNIAALESAGWRVLVIWECETRKSDQLMERMGTFLRN